MLTQALPPTPPRLSPLVIQRQAAAPAVRSDQLQLAGQILKVPLPRSHPAAGMALQQPLSASASAPLPGPGKVTLDLLSLNVFSLPKPVGQNIAARSVQIGSTLHRYDIAALQETFSGDTRAIAETLAARGAAYQNYKPMDHRLGTSGLQIFSKYPIVARDFQGFYFSTDEDALAKKGVAFVRLNVPGIGFVDVYDTHYQANGDKALPWFKDLLRKAVGVVLPGATMPHDAIRMHDNQVMVEMVRKHDQGYPTFVMGDFNAADNTPVIPALREALQLHDSFRELHPQDPGFSSDGELNPIKGGGHSRKRLDYILYKPGRHVDVRPILSELAYNQPGEYVSDHFGVHTRFELVKK